MAPYIFFYGDGPMVLCALCLVDCTKDVKWSMVGHLLIMVRLCQGYYGPPDLLTFVFFLQPLIGSMGPTCIHIRITVARVLIAMVSHEANG